MKHIAIAIGIVLSGCGSTRTDHGELDEARVQVRRFFDAMARADCATAASLLPAARDAGACAKLLHEWRDDLQMQLIEVPDVRRDGRDRRAIIVRTIVLRRGKQSTMLVRVTHEQGVWQLVL